MENAYFAFDVDFLETRFHRYRDEGRGGRLCTGGNFVGGPSPSSSSETASTDRPACVGDKKLFFYAEIDCPKSFADKTPTVLSMRGRFEFGVQTVNTNAVLFRATTYLMAHKKRFPNSTKHAYRISTFSQKSLVYFFELFPLIFFVFLLVLPLSV